MFKMENLSSKNNYKALQLVECPRDAMQGWPHFIDTKTKADYINQLLKVGFHTIDFGSFVSPKAIPQMKDTKEVLSSLKIEETSTQLLSIVANLRGAEEAVVFDEISYIGFPFSISPTFQLRNTNSTIEESLQTVDAIQEICTKQNKQLVIYLSMGFGNPYGDDYNEDVLLHFAHVMAEKNIRIISLSDTVGVATPEQINIAFSTLIPRHPNITFGAHLHTTQKNYEEKLQAALDAGCRRFDGAIKGIGGCPMAGNDLVGNMPTELMIDYLERLDFYTHINHAELNKSIAIANEIFV